MRSILENQPTLIGVGKEAIPELLQVLWDFEMADGSHLKIPISASGDLSEAEYVFSQRGGG